MEVTSATQTSTATAANSASQPMINSDFQTFLTMLTTQMQNQDPLNPMESTEFATQLATFSGVEQQVRTNELLGTLQQSLGLSSMGEMAGWIGMDARAAMPMAFGGEPLTLIADDNPMADRMELVVTDAAGNEMQRMSLPGSGMPIQWAGVTSDGAPLPEGVYGFHVEYFNEDVAIDSQPAQGYARIMEAQMVDGEVWLSMPGGVQIRASLVEGVREAG